MLATQRTQKDLNENQCKNKQSDGLIFSVSHSWHPDLINALTDLVFLNLLTKKKDFKEQNTHGCSKANSEILCLLQCIFSILQRSVQHSVFTPLGCEINAHVIFRILISDKATLAFL